jgi:hypothetical protein
LTALDQHKNILWRSALASNSPHNMQLFREVRNQYIQSVRKVRKCASYSTNRYRYSDQSVSCSDSWCLKLEREILSKLDVVYHSAIRLVTKAQFTNNIW